MRRRGSKLLDGVSMRCRGCGRTVAAAQMSATQLADLLSWDRADDGDWCIECQWDQGRIPAFARRLASLGKRAG